MGWPRGKRIIPICSHWLGEKRRKRLGEKEGLVVLTIGEGIEDIEEESEGYGWDVASGLDDTSFPDGACIPGLGFGDGAGDAGGCCFGSGERCTEVVESAWVVIPLAFHVLD